MWGTRLIVTMAALVLALGGARADVITRLPTSENVIALTFDACEAGQPVAFDRAILDYLIAQRIPFTVFVTGRFVQTNTEDVTELAKLDFVEIENHSWSHPNTMDSLPLDTVRYQVTRAGEAITKAIGHKPQFFRFPAGNYSAASLAVVEGLGYKVVHWSWATGDPSPLESRNGLIRRVQMLTRPGHILIFHINGRGVHTAEALPTIVDDLRKRGYRFAKLADYLGNHPAQASVAGHAVDQTQELAALRYFAQTAHATQPSNPAVRQLPRAAH